MELKNRSQYLDKLISVQDMEVIKVVTGIRRCGKSSLLKLMMAHLREQGGMEEQILSMNFESMQFADMDSKSLYQYVMERAPKGKRLYLFLDEVQKVRDWQDAVNPFRVDLDCDIYVTGSNAYLLSSELSTYLSGRYNAATLEFPLLSRIPSFRIHAPLQRCYGVRCAKKAPPGPLSACGIGRGFFLFYRSSPVVLRRNRPTARSSSPVISKNGTGHQTWPVWGRVGPPGVGFAGSGGSGASGVGSSGISAA